MSEQSSKVCRWCEGPLVHERNYCTSDCRRLARQHRSADPTPEEIREMCHRIQEEGGIRWLRSRTCYASRPLDVRVVTSIRSVACAYDD